MASGFRARGWAHAQNIRIAAARNFVWGRRWYNTIYNPGRDTPLINEPCLDFWVSGCLDFLMWGFLDFHNALISWVRIASIPGFLYIVDFLSCLFLVVLVFGLLEFY